MNSEHNPILRDPNLIYDYNEVLELFFDSDNALISITGHTGLNKSELLKSVRDELLSMGTPSDSILYYDLHIPMNRNVNAMINTLKLAIQENERTIYLFIDEISQVDDLDFFFQQVTNMKIKVLMTCSVPHIIYKKQYNEEHGLKTIVISEKNMSNIKFEQVTFGTHGFFKYNIKGETCEIKGLTKEGKQEETLDVPETIDGYPVKIIASGAFHHRRKLKKISLPKTVHHIGDYAFTYCENLGTIAFPETLEYIGDCAFMGAKNLEQINGGSNLNHIGNSAFMGTAWLNSYEGDWVRLGKTLYCYLGNEAHVKIPDGIHSLASYAFESSWVRSVDLNQVTHLSEGIFYDCQYLETIEKLESKHIPAYFCYNCISLNQSFGDIIRVGKFAFYNAIELASFSFDKAHIQNNAFEACSSLKITNNYIHTLGKAAFYQSGLVHADFRLIKSLAPYALAHTQILEMHAPNIQFVGSNALSHINTLRSIEFNPETIVEATILNHSMNVKFAKIGGQYKLDYYFGDTSPIETLNVLGDTVANFARNNPFLNTLRVSGKRIGPWAFYNNGNLESITLEVNRLGPWAFAYCSSLESVKLPKSINHIDMNAFRYCRNLKHIRIESTMPVSFGANAFYSTYPEKTFEVHDKEKYMRLPIWKEYRDHLKSIHTYTKQTNHGIEYYENGSESPFAIKITDMQEIDQEITKRYASIRELEIDTERITLHDWAFANFENLERVEIKAERAILNNYVFQNCSRLKTVRMPENIQIKGKGTFAYNTVINDYHQPKSSTIINEREFSHCKNLKRIFLSPNLTTIGKKSFQFCESLEYVYIPEGVTHIGSQAFRNCRSLKLVSFPSTLKHVGDDLFENTDNVTLIIDKNMTNTIINTLCMDSVKKIVHSSQLLENIALLNRDFHDYLGKTFDVEIDRPIGITHPKHSHITYPINYGLIPNVMGGDGELQDVYIIDSTQKENNTINVTIIGVVFRFDDNETKWIGIKENTRHYENKHIKDIINFQEQFYETIIFTV